MAPITLLGGEIFLGDRARGARVARPVGGDRAHGLDGLLRRREREQSLARSECSSLKPVSWVITGLPAARKQTLRSLNQPLRGRT